MYAIKIYAIVLSNSYAVLRVGMCRYMCRNISIPKAPNNINLQLFKLRWLNSRICVLLQIMEVNSALIGFNDVETNSHARSNPESCAQTNHFFSNRYPLILTLICIFFFYKATRM